MKVSNREQMDKLSNTSSIFAKINKGETKVRVIGDVHCIKEHELKVKGKFRAIACPTENARMAISNGETQDMEVPPCPLCEKGYPVKTKYLAKIIEREYEKDGKHYGGEALILKKGSGIFTEIMNLLDDENWGREGNYDIKITATGDGLERKYSVLAIPVDKSVPLTKREQMSLEELERKVSLDEMTTPLKYDEIVEKVGEDLMPYSSLITDDVPF